MYADPMSGVTAREPPVVPARGSWPQWVRWANRLPNCSEIGLECVEVGPGSALFALPTSGWTLNPNGAVNGGLVIAAADQCMGVVALTTLAEGSLPATATLNAEFLRPAFGPLSFRAAVVQQGRRLVFVTVEVEDAAGRLCVKCSGTMAAQSSGPEQAPAAAAMD
jgi:uncharacterized protein (TIGR00369 family)